MASAANRGPTSVATAVTGVTRTRNPGVRSVSRSPAARTKEVPNAPSKTTASTASESPGRLGQAVGVGLGGGAVGGGTGGAGVGVQAAAPTALTPNAARKVLRFTFTTNRPAPHGFDTGVRLAPRRPAQPAWSYLPVPA